jgi:hypothetical protein
VREEKVGSSTQVQTVVRELTPAKLSEGITLRPPRDDDLATFTSQELTSDGRFYAWCGPRQPDDRRRVEVYNIQTRERLFYREIRGEHLPDSMAHLSPDGRFLWLGAFPGKTQLVDVKSGVDIAPPAREPYPFSHDAQWAILSEPPDQHRISNVATLCRWPETSPFIELINDHIDSVTSKSIAFSPDGRYLAWGTRRGTVFVAEIGASEQALRLMVEELDKK